LLVCRWVVLGVAGWLRVVLERGVGRGWLATADR
jgi:hypothetical protein